MGGFGLPFFFIHIHMAIPTTVDTDTELSAVNSILGAIGQSPVTSLGPTETGTGDTINFANPEIGFIYNILTEVNKDVQNEGWVFNTELGREFPLSSGKIPIPANVLRFDLHGDHHDRSKNLIRKNGYLYDTNAHTDIFTNSLELDVTWLWAFTDLPPAFKRYIISRASLKAFAEFTASCPVIPSAIKSVSEGFTDSDIC